MKLNALGAALVFACTLRAQQGCAVSQDLVVRALELASATPSRDDLAGGILLLKQAQEACDENGDAWYYRSVFERKLGQGNPQYALGKARERNSAALQNAEDPFTLATPSRDLRGSPRQTPQAANPNPAPADPRNPGVRQKWALVVGISRFRNARLNLKFAREDAAALSSLLLDAAYGRFRDNHVRQLADDQATTVNIRAGLNWLARSAAPGDLAVIYIATHGTARELDVAGVNYLITHDADVESLDGLYSTTIPMVEISNVIRTRIKALRVVVILDTCHSQGAVAQTVAIPQSLSQPAIDRIREGTGRMILAASRTEESSYEIPRFGHGLFTWYLLQGLKQQKDAPIGAVFQYVQEQVAREAAANGWQQHPVFSASDELTNVVLSVPPLAAIFRARPAPWSSRHGL